MTDADLMQDASEIVFYDHPDIPVYIKESDLSEYPDMKALCHWHEDIEMIHIIGGEMNYQINGSSILLKEEDCIVINSRQMHYGYSYFHHDCRFACIRFHPKLLGANPMIYKNFVEPFIENTGIKYLYFDKNVKNRPVRELFVHILSLKSGQEDAYELEVIGTLLKIWRILFRQCKTMIQQETTPDDSDLALQKKMVSYIYEHYRDTVTLEEIAASANISRSKCCIIFKQYLQQSPVDFLNRYRLERSRLLLENTEFHITQIAFSCGFNHLSYFSRLFLREFGCTPTEFRRQCLVCETEEPMEFCPGSL